MLEFSPITEALEAFTAGEFVIVVDDENRENEGDLIMAAEYMTPDKMAFLIRYCSGIVCLPMSTIVADQLQLPPMVERNTSRHGTPFTISVEAAEGISTGVSAADRTITTLCAAKPNAKPSDLVSPGHMFPLRAAPAGVLERNGHTEAAVDLCKLTGKREVGVLCELMHTDGTMMRLPALQEFAKEHALLLISIADLTLYIKRGAVSVA